jgi:hypothetical protein
MCLRAVFGHCKVCLDFVIASFYNQTYFIIKYLANNASSVRVEHSKTSHNKQPAVLVPLTIQLRQQELHTKVNVTRLINAQLEKTTALGMQFV